MTETGDFVENLLMQARCGFDAEASVEPGDDELIRRMARRAQKPALREPRSRVRYFAQGAAVGALLTGVAFAGVQAVREHFAHVDPSVAPPGTPKADDVAALKHARGNAAPAAATAATAPPDAVAAPTEVAPQAPEPPGVGRAPHARETASSPTAGAASPPGAAAEAPTTGNFADAPGAQPQGAAELFGAANRARVRGDVAAAVSLYRALEAQFPASAEANAAHLSLGVLYLKQHQAGAALDELGKRRGSTDAEVLWTAAQALRELGRNTEERTRLEQLVSAFPSSAYVTAARKRLAELR